MGANQSAVAKGVLPSVELKWKSGNRESPLPYPEAGNKTYEQLCKDESFRYFIYSNLHDEYLINSLISAFDEELLSEGVDILKKLDADTRAATLHEIGMFEEILGTGVKFSLPTALKWNENFLQSALDIRASPFFMSFQKRLAVLRAFEASIHDVRLKAQNSKMPREYHSGALNSSAHPQILLFDSMKNTGLAVLLAFPILYKAIESPIHIELLLAPIRVLCQDISAMKDLCLFTAWAPRPAPAKRILCLRPDQLKASRGDAAKAIDGLSTTCWMCKAQRGVWSVQFDSPVAVSSLNISWVAGGATPVVSTCGAPETLVIYTRSASNGGLLRKAKVFDVNESYKENRSSWTHAYTLEAADGDVSYIELHMLGYASANHASCIKMYSIDVTSLDPQARSMDPLLLCTQLQDALFGLVPLAALEDLVFTSLLALIKSTGSLSIIIKFAKFIAMHQLEAALVKAARPSLDSLYNALGVTLATMRSMRAKGKDSAVKARFDDSFKSSSIELSDNGTLATCKATGPPPSYAQLSCLMESGVYEWEFTVEEGCDDFALGVSLRPIINLADTSAECWLVRRSQSSASTTPRLVYVGARVNDTFRFTFDVAARTVRVYQNGTDSGIVFEDVPPAVSPVVLFYDASSIRLLSLSHQPSLAAEPSIVPTGEALPETTAPAEPKSELSILLDHVANIAKTRLEWVEEYRATSPSMQFELEYPYAIEVSKELIDEVFSLIYFFADSATGITAKDIPTITSLLQILEAQFSILGNTNPNDIGYAGLSTDDPVLQKEIACLRSLLNYSHRDIQVAAAKVFARGSPLFFPRIMDRIELVSSLFQELRGQTDAPIFNLLSIVFNHLSSYVGIMNVITEFKTVWATAPSNDNALFTLCKCVLDFLASLPSAVLADFQQVAYTFIIRLLEMLCLELLDAAVSSEGIVALFSFLTKHIIASALHLLASPAVTREDFFSTSILGRILHPLLHAVCFCSCNLQLLHAIHPFVTLLLKETAALGETIPAIVDASRLFQKALPLSTSSPACESGNKGWHQVNCSFENDSSYTLEDNGTVYESVTSSNTCGVLNVTFTSPQRAAWEFLLEGDSNGDECSVFGAAQIPFSSRCYSSSPDLWMRRSYNGYMYSRGRTIDTGSMEKIHPGDLVRIEFDGKAGTLSFGVNGQDMEVGFTEVTGVISPSAGSYRSGVKIRLVKVEVFRANASSDDPDDLSRSPAILYWELDSEIMQTRSRDILSPVKEKKDKKETFEHAPDVRVVTSKADRSVSGACGIYEWSFEVLELSRSLLAFGLSTGPIPAGVLLGEAADSSPVVAWRSDGTLWCDGQKIGDDFGRSLFPLKRFSVVSMELNLYTSLVSFRVDGVLVGVPFNSSNCTLFKENHAYFPAATVTSPFQMIRLHPAGYNGPLALPQSLFFIKSVASSFARTSSALLLGPQADDKEIALLPWLKSPLLIGGLDDQHALDNGDLADWRALWNAGTLDSLLATEKFTLRKPSPIARSSSLDVSIDIFIHKIAHGDSDGDSSICSILEDWLNSAVDKDNATLRAVLEKSNSYSFPRCERPFVAAMLKHGGLFQEAMQAVLDLQNGKTPTPSNDMRALWKRVRQLRVYLRQQRQTYMSTESLPVEATAELSISDVAVHVDDVTLTPEVSPVPVVAPQDAFEFILNSASVVWIEQTNVVSRYSDNYQCQIHSVGIDTANRLLYIKFTARTNNADGDLQSPVESVVLIGATEIAYPAHKYDVENPSAEIRGSLRFEWPEGTDMAVDEVVTFTYGSSGYSAAVLNLRVASIDDTVLLDGAAAQSFEQVCDKIETRAFFLLKLVYAGSTETSKLLNQRVLSPSESRASGASGSQDASDRWKKVVEFLRVHTSVRREKSKISTPEESFMDDVEDDQFSTNAALKACTLFVTSDGATAAPSLLLDILQRRHSRVVYRTFAQDSIAEILGSAVSRGDLSALHEITLFLKSSLSSAVTSAGIALPTTRMHYLNSLEGCSAISLRTLQDSFLNVFSQLTVVLEKIVDALEPSEEDPLSVASPGKYTFNIISTLLSLWFMHFSNRDHRFLIDCGFLRILYKLSSYAFYEAQVARYLKAAIELIGLKATSSRSSIDALYASKPFMSNALADNLKTGRISVRDVYFNLLMLPESTLTTEEKAAVGLDRDPKLLLTSVSPYDATLQFQKAVLAIRKREESQKMMAEAEQAEKARQEKIKYETDFAIVRASGIPLFDASKKADDVYLDNFDQCAGVKASRSSSNVVSLFATACYDVHQGATDSGNYFEIKVLNLGTRDIGVGLGTAEDFQLNGQMPGWEAHSYGYHGDDGRKFGANATPGTWPLFDANDVIGCGFDFIRRSIFYTRNGELLGVGFTGVVDEVLYPIIGFHGSGVDQKVSINFGVEPFLYSGPEVHVNAKSLIEREARRLKALVSEIAPPIPTTSEAEPSIELIPVKTPDTTANGQKEAPSAAVLESLESMRYQVEALSNTIRELKEIRKYARGLLSFYLALISENDAALPVWTEPMSLTDNTRTKRSPMLKGRSTFGTLKAETFGDGAMLLHDICSFFIDEVKLSSQYFAATKTNRGFLFAQTSLTEEVSGSLGEYSVVLDQLEVDDSAYQYLLGLRSVLHLSKQVKVFFCSSDIVAYLLPLLQSASVRIRDVVHQFLCASIPDLVPESIEQVLEQNEMTSALLSTVQPTEIPGINRRSRKLPDSIIRILFEIVQAAVAVQKSTSPRIGLGVGGDILHRGTRAAALIHHLLESVAYAELVSCFLTDSIRSLEDIVPRLTSNSAIDSYLTNAFASATAVCFLISGIASKNIKGFAVRSAEGNTGVLVSADSVNATALFADSYKDASDVQEVPLTSLTLLPKSMVADLSSLSQPLLPQLIALFKELLLLIHANKSHLSSRTASNANLWRLASTLSMALSTLIESRHDAVIDAIQYAGIISNIVAIALFECPLVHFMTPEEALHLWMEAQAKSKELDPVDLVAVTEEPSVTVPLETAVAVDEATVTAGAPSALLDTLSKELSVEFTVAEIECRYILDYFMQDVAKTREYLKDYKPAPDVPEEAPVAKSNGELLLSCVDSQSNVSSATQSHYALYRLSNAALSAVDTALVSDASIVYEFDSESIGAQTGALGQLVDWTTEGSDVLVAYLQRSRSIHMVEIAKKSNLKVVTSFFDCTHSDELADFLFALDRTLVSLRMREIVMHLLLDGSINLDADAAALSDWLRFIKLCSISKIGGHAPKSVADLCAALMKVSSASLRENSESAPSYFCDLLLNDALESLQKMMTPPKSSLLSKEKQPALKSPHPFVDNHIVTGKICLPANENGCLLSFDPRSCTPSPKATFTLYLSKDDLDADNASYTFWGAQDTESRFKSIYIPQTACIYYKFNAVAGSNKPELQVTSQDVAIRVNHGDRVVKRDAVAGPSGTGDDDNLGNFFSPQAPACSTVISYAFCDCEWISAGSWYFEVTYVIHSTDESLDDAPSATEGGAKAGLFIGGFEAHEEHPESMLMLDILGNFTLPLAALESVPPLQNGDVISCYFSVVDASAEVKFAVNGKWTESVRCEISAKGIKPGFAVNAKSSFKWNFGEAVFLYAPEALPFQPVIRRPADIDAKTAWGYELHVEESDRLPHSIVRKFDLLWESKDAASPVFIWRPKPSAGFANFGDVVTTSKQIPVGALTVDKLFTAAPVDFEQVLHCSKTNIGLWSPVAPEGFVSVGDVFYYSSDSSVKPSTDSCVCIPTWAARKTDVDSKLYSNKVAKDGRITYMSIWSLSGVTGNFRGSNTVDSSDLPNPLWAVYHDAANEITGEWSNERDVTTKPSLSWSCEVLEYLLREPKHGIEVLFSNTAIFGVLVDYISSAASVNPFKVVPVLIKFIRCAAESKSKTVEISKLKALCKSIAHSMTSRTGDHKRGFGHQLLVDLAVEYGRYKLLHDDLATQGSASFQYSPEWSESIPDADKVLARLGDVSSVVKLFASNSTALQTISNVLSFFYSLETSVDAQILPLSATIVRKVWFQSLSLLSVEESEHPHCLEKFSKTISYVGAESYSIVIDRRSDLAANCSLKVSGGGSSFLFSSGDDADTYTKPIVFVCSELRVEFECPADASELSNSEHWGWAILVECTGPVFEWVTVTSKLNTISADNDATSFTPLLADEAEPHSDAASPETAVPPTDDALVEEPAAKDSDARSLALKNFQLEITDEVMAKVVEIGKLVGSGEVDLPYVVEKTIEVKGYVAASAAGTDSLVYVVTLVCLEGEEVKTQRTTLGSNSSFTITVSKCSSIAYMIHASFEKALKEIFMPENLVMESADPTTDTPVAAVEVEPAPAVDTDDSWSCTVCTFHNIAGTTECEMCGNACPSQSSPGVIQVSWFCRACTLINVGDSRRCAACDADRDRAAEEAPVALLDSASPSESSDDEEGYEGFEGIRHSRQSILRGIIGSVVRAPRESASFVASETPEVAGAERAQDTVDTVVIKFKGSYSQEQRFEVRLERAMADKRLVPAALQRNMTKWNHQFDNVLLEFINSLNISSEELATSKISIPKQTFGVYQSSSFFEFSLLDMQARFQIIQHFNNAIKDVLPSLNLLNPDAGSLGAMIRRFNRYIFLNIKQPLLDTALEETLVSSGTGLPGSFTLNNFKSISSKESGETEPAKCMNCFVQAFNQLSKKDIKVYKHIFSGDRVFQITFEGESGIDAGGVFREGMSRIVEDLFSEHFKLLLLCPNGKHNVHINTEKYVPNPVYSSGVELQMFEFIGRLMGASMRAKLCLPFDFAPLVWKILVGDELVEEDFLAFDAISFKQVMKIRDCDKEAVIDNDTFELMYEEKFYFTCLGTDGVEHELCPGGRTLAVNFDNRLDYCDKVTAFRLHEFDVQVSAIKRGLEDVVPIHLLQLFSWQQIEILVAGNPTFDLSVWKAHTDSDGVSSKTSALFWKVMETLSPKEQSGFIRFAWGRSRLPPEKQFTTKMRLTDGGRASLPVSHTCFFSIELPAYETEAEMRRGLLTAIHFGVGGILMG